MSINLSKLLKQDIKQLSSEDISGVNTVYTSAITNQNPLNPTLKTGQDQVTLLGYDATDDQAYNTFKEVEESKEDTLSWWDKNIVQPSVRLGTRSTYYAYGLTGQAIEEFGIMTGKNFITEFGQGLIDIADQYSPAMESYKGLEKAGKLSGDEEFILDAVQFATNLGVNVYAGGLKATAGALSGIGQIAESAFDIDTDDTKQSMSTILNEFVTDVSIEQQQAYQELKEEEGSVDAIAYAVGQTFADIRGNLQLMKSLGIRLPQSLRGKPSATKGKIALERLKAAAVISTYRGLTTRGDAAERGKAAATTMVYMSTPALSGWFNNNWKVIGSDFVLNSVWSATPLWKNGNDYKSIWENKDLDLTDKMAQTISILGTDAFFSIITKSFKQSPEYRAIKAEEKQVFDTVVESAKNNISQNNPEWRTFETPQSIATRNAVENNGGFIEVHRQDVVAQKAITDMEQRLNSEIKDIELNGATSKASLENKQLLLDTILTYKDAPQAIQIKELEKSQIAINKGKSSVKNRAEKVNGKEQPLSTIVNGKEYTYKENNWYSEAGNIVKGERVLKSIQKNFAENVGVSKQDIDTYIEQRRQFESRINAETTARQAQERGEAKMLELNIKPLETKRILETENKLIEATAEMIRAGSLNNKSQFVQFIKSVSDKYTLRNEQVNNIYHKAMGRVKSEQRLIRETERTSKPAKITQKQFKPTREKVLVDPMQIIKDRIRTERDAVVRGKKLGKAEEVAKQKQRADDLSTFKSEIKQFARETFKGKDTSEKYNKVIGRIESVKTPSDVNLNKLIKIIEDVQADKEKSIAISEAKKVFANVKKRANSRDPSKRLSDDLAKAFEAINERISTTKPTKKTIDRVEASLKYFEKIKEKDGTEIPEFITKSINKLTKQSLQDLSTREINQITKALENIVYQQKTINELDARQQQRKITKAIDDYSNQPTIKQSPLYKDAEAKKEMINSKIYTPGGLLNAKRILELPPRQIMFTLDGWRNGVLVKEFYDRFTKADDKEALVRSKALPLLINVQPITKDFDKRNIKVVIGGQKIQITKGERVSIYLDSLNKDNDHHVLNGGYVTKDVRDRPLRITLEERNAILQKITNNELKVAKNIIEVYSRLSRYIDETSKEINGFSISVPNYTNPIINANLPSSKFGKDSFITPENMSGFNRTLIGSNSHLQERVDGAKNAIQIHDALKTATSMVSMVAKYHGYAVPLRDAKQILNGTSNIKTSSGTYQSFKSLIETNYGKQYYNALTKLVEDLEGNYVKPELSGKLEKSLQWANNNFARGALMFNIPVATMQPISYNQAKFVMPKKYWDMGLKSKSASWKEMGQYSPFLWSRSQGRYSIAYGETVTNQLLDKLMWTIKEGDRQSVGKIWNASKEWVKDEFPNLEVGSDKYFAKVAEKANMVVRRTQPTFETIDRPELARSKNEVLRAFALFSSQRNKNAGLLYENEIGMFKKIQNKEAGIKDYINFFDRWITTAVATPVMVAVHAANWKASIGLAREYFYVDEEDRRSLGEIYTEDIINKLVSVFSSDRGMVTQQILNGVKSIVQKFGIERFNKRSEDYKIPELDVYGFQLPLIQTYSRFINSASKLITKGMEISDLNYINEDTEQAKEEWNKHFYGLVKASSTIGYGAGNVWDFGMLIYYIIMNNEEFIDEIDEFKDDVIDLGTDVQRKGVGRTVRAALEKE
jgi:hypothetical protein